MRLWIGKVSNEDSSSYADALIRCASAVHKSGGGCCTSGQIGPDLLRTRDGLNKSVDCSSTHRKLSRADGLFRVSLGDSSFRLEVAEVSLSADSTTATWTGSFLQPSSVAHETARTTGTRCAERVHPLARGLRYELYLTPSAHGGLILAFVTMREGEGGEQLLKRFQSSMQRSGVLRELRNRRFFRSKGEQSRLDKARSLRRIRRRRTR